MNKFLNILFASIIILNYATNASTNKTSEQISQKSETNNSFGKKFTNIIPPEKNNPYIAKTKMDINRILKEKFDEITASKEKYYFSSQLRDRSTNINIFTISEKLAAIGFLQVDTSTNERLFLHEFIEQYLLEYKKYGNADHFLYSSRELEKYPNKSYFGVLGTKNNAPITEAKSFHIFEIDATMLDVINALDYAIKEKKILDKIELK